MTVLTTDYQNMCTTMTQNMTLDTTSTVPSYYGPQSGLNTLLPVYSLKQGWSRGRAVYPHMVICCNPHYTLKRMLQMRGFTHPNYNWYQLNNSLNKNLAVFPLSECVIFFFPTLNTLHRVPTSNRYHHYLPGMRNHQSYLQVVCWSCVNYILCL